MDKSSCFLPFSRNPVNATKPWYRTRPFWLSSCSYLPISPASSLTESGMFFFFFCWAFATVELCLSDLSAIKHSVSCHFACTSCFGSKPGFYVLFPSSVRSPSSSFAFYLCFQRCCQTKNVYTLNLANLGFGLTSDSLCVRFLTSPAHGIYSVI